MDTDSLIYHIKTDDFYADIADDFNAGFAKQAATVAKQIWFVLFPY